MAGVPVRFIVGYAARCARRVQPLYYWEGVDPKKVHAIEEAIRNAEAFSRAINHWDPVAGNSALAAASAANAVADTAPANIYIAYSAAANAAAAAAASTTAVLNGNDVDPGKALFGAAEAAVAAADAAGAANADASTAVYVAAHAAADPSDAAVVADAVAARVYAASANAADFLQLEKLAKEIDAPRLAWGYPTVTEEFTARPLWAEGEPKPIAKNRPLVEEILKHPLEN